MATIHANQVVITAEPGKQELFITREFDAPRYLIYRAFTEPDLYVQWLGPRRMKMTLVQFEPYSGGRWRFIHEDNKGNKYGFHGVYHEMSPSLMIDTFEFEGLPEKGHVSLETLRLEDLPAGRTRLSVQSVFQSVADRDGMIGSGMETGVRESYDSLDDLLQRLKMQSQTTKLVPYLIFGGNCREAMNFYKECLGGELRIMTVGESPMAAQTTQMKDMVMHSVLETSGMFIMASDNMGQENIVNGNSISLTITGKKKEEIESYFLRLSSGGKVSHPIEKVFFGWYGDFTDKFGINWMFQADS